MNVMSGLGGRSDRPEAERREGLVRSPSPLLRRGRLCLNLDDRTAWADADC
jgi:hypothetical protein